MFLTEYGTHACIHVHVPHLYDLCTCMCLCNCACAFCSMLPFSLSLSLSFNLSHTHTHTFIFPTCLPLPGQHTLPRSMGSSRSYSVTSPHSQSSSGIVGGGGGSDGMRHMKSDGHLPILETHEEKMVYIQVRNGEIVVTVALTGQLESL